MSLVAWFEDPFVIHLCKIELPSDKPILSLRIFILCRERAFASRSTSWSCVLTWWTLMIPYCIMSRTKCRSIWICFIQESYIRLKLRCVAPKLSHSNLGCPDNDKSSFLNNKRSQDVFEAALTSALYSTLVDEYVTAICLFEYQEIGLTQRKLIYAYVDVRSS
jgi:hypothetical protein